MAEYSLLALVGVRPMCEHGGDRKGTADAWRTPTRNTAQWTGDCGAAGIQEVDADGSFAPIGGGGNRRLISIEGDRMVVLEWNGCDGSEGRLVATDPSGVVTAELVPIIGDAWGVRDAATLSTVYP